MFEGTFTLYVQTFSHLECIFLIYLKTCSHIDWRHVSNRLIVFLQNIEATFINNWFINQWFKINPEGSKGLNMMDEGLFKTFFKCCSSKTLGPMNFLSPGHTSMFDVRHGWRCPDVRTRVPDLLRPCRFWFLRHYRKKSGGKFGLTSILY